MKNYIHAHTESEQNYIKDKKITNNQWKVYYYLLSQSKYNAKSIEDHRYLYKKDINITQICKYLGIKSTTTYRTAIEKLCDSYLIVDKENYYLLYAKNWISIDADVMKALLSFCQNDAYGVDLLRSYLIIKKIDSLAKNDEDRSFTVRDIVVLLGHGKNDAIQYQKIRTYIALLSYWQLIRLKAHTATHPHLGKYIVYHIQKTGEDNISPDLIIDITTEMQGTALPQKIIDQVNFTIPQLAEKF